MTTPNFYPADGSYSTAPDPVAWAEHDPVQEATNRGGMIATRQELHGRERAQELPGLNRFDRIDTLGRIVGFLPASLPEQTEVLSLQSFITRPSGAAKHLAGVARHQQGAATDDPLRAPRAITRGYIDWATDAQASVDALKSVQDELAEDVNPKLVMDRVFDSEKPDARLLPFLRFFDLSVLRDTGDINAVGYDPQKVKYTPDNNGIMFYLDQALATWHVQQVRKQLPQAISHETNREAFWIARIGEVARHFKGRKTPGPMAREALEKLIATKPSKDQA